MFASIFLALWVVGSVSSYTMGGFLHVLLIASIGMMLPRIVWGKKAAN